MSMEERKLHIRIPVRRVAESTSIFIVAAILFIGAQYVFATAPNPGHNFSEVGGGAVQGDILYGSAADTLSALPKNTTATRYLANTGTSNNPQWDQVNLTNGVTGILPVGTGGTGWANVTSGAVLYGNGASALATTTAGTGGYVLAYLNGVPTWAATTTLSTITGTLALNKGGTNGSLVASNGGIVYSDASQFQILGGTATAGQILRSGASAAPTWSTATYPATAGTAGQVLMSNGTNWISAATSSSGTFIKTQTLTAGTTYTPSTGTKAVFLRMCGGGGGGGGAKGGSSSADIGGGGGSGSYLEKFVTFSVTAASYTIAIGSAGSAGASSGGAGGAGGSTTFACDSNCSSGSVTFTANGGNGGANLGSGTSVLPVSGGTGGGISLNGDVNSAGQTGYSGFRTSGTTGWSGAGADTPFGGGGNQISAAGAGNAGSAFCSGGSGGVSFSTTGQAGGAGKGGVIVVYEYR